MKRLPAYVLPLAFTALATIQSSTYAAVDMFLKVADIQGESVDKTHANEIDVLAWSWQLSQSKDPANPIVRPLLITKFIDSASPPLYDLLLTGTLAKDAILTVRKAGGTPLEYLIITMTDVTVSTVSNGASGGEDRLTENISLNFSSACMKYTPQGADGAGLTPIETCWTYGSNP
ncbi:MAG: type VI secretion system secreted protein Hcp [Enterobacterales bacterium]|jgi:type VI secretion system secreted protein Hcp